LSIGRDKRIDVRRRRRLADIVRHIQGKEIAPRDKPIDRLQVDVVGIDIIVFVPAKGFDRRIRLFAEGNRLAFDDGVFAKGLVPHRINVEAIRLRLEDRLKLRVTLMSEAIAHSEGVFLDLHGRKGKQKYNDGL